MSIGKLLDSVIKMVTMTKLGATKGTLLTAFHNIQSRV